jgi:hypothetical protein
MEPETWPLPRRNRVGGGAVAKEGAPPAPRTRIFPWALNIAGSRRQSFTFPRTVGPVIIKQFAWFNSFGNDPPNMTLELGTATAPILETNAALTAPRPYTILTELQDSSGLMPDAAGVGFPLHNIPNTHINYTLPLDIIIPDAEVFVVLASINNSANAGALTGHLTLLENVDRFALANFL